jgi:hypothetical protein
MLSIGNINRKTVLVLSVVLANLVVAMIAQSAHAQSLDQIRRAVVSTGSGTRIFSINTTLRMGEPGNAILEITTLSADGSLVGKYYRAGTGTPEATNVTGAITIGRGIRISFTVTEPAAIGSNDTVFEGAIRLGGPPDPRQGVMSGTYTNTVLGGAPDGAGPFPFCATLTVVKPG